jgi:hypothetical protein
MRILRGLSSRLLPCGCLTGVYETYSNEIIVVVDARGQACAEPSHGPGEVLSAEESSALRGDPHTLDHRTRSA